MNFEEFQKLAMRTEPDNRDTVHMDVQGVKRLLRMYIGVGDLLDYNKKGIFYNKYEKYDENFMQLMTNIDESFLDHCNVDTERKDVNTLNFRILHGLLGAITEASEIASILLKYLETGEIDKANVGEEFSDSDWYKAIAYDELGLDEVTTRTNVIDKLRIRFPDKFDDEKAANRDLAAERQELEKGI